jgi:FkbM family methyltransferase
MYPVKTLTSIYNFILKLTQKRGSITLAKIDCFLFKINRNIKIGNDGSIYLELPPDPHFFGYLTQTHENHVSRAIERLVTKGDVIIDIGANIGYFSAYCLNAVGKEGKVYSIEPESRNFGYLSNNCVHWNKLGFNIKSYQLAVSSTNGELKLNIHRYSTYHTLENSNNCLDKIENTQTVSVITLDSWTTQEKINSISLLKIDTEGHEIKVLEGATSLFEKGRVEMAILECRDDQIAEFIDNFSTKFNLHQYVYDSSDWIESRSLPIKNRLESLVSKKYISLSILNQL